MKYPKRILLFLTIIISFATILPISTVNAQTSEPVNCDDRGFLGFPSWYRGLADQSAKDAGECVVINELNDFWLIALNLLEIITLFLGYIAASVFMYGGFLLMTSRGRPDYVAEGQATLRNSAIGLVISIAAVAAINFFVGGLLK